MKKLLLLVLVLTVLLSCAACGKTGDTETQPAGSEPSAENPADASEAGNDPAPSTPAVVVSDRFPTGLMGAWECVKAVIDGEETDSYYLSIGFNYDGTTWSDYTSSAAYAATDTVTINGNEMIFSDGGIPEGVTVTYELAHSDAPVDEFNKTYEALFKNQEYNTLILHLTGSYKDGPTTVVQVDYTLTLEKIMLQFESSLRYALIGDWSDNFGNQWHFEKEADSASLAFTMTDSDGNTYNGAGHTAVSFLVTEEPNFEFRISDILGSNAGLNISGPVNSFDGYTLNVTQEDGSELILTRVES